MKFKIKLSPAAVVSTSILIAVVMLTSSFIELNQSKKEIYQLLYEHSSSLLESVIQSSANTLNTSFEVEDLITKRLFDNARLVKSLDGLGLLTRNELIKISENNNLYRINIFDIKGNRILSNRIPEPGHIHGEENINRFDELSPILKGEAEELIIGLKSAEFSDEERFAVAVARSKNKGAIVININAQDFLEFRKKIGIGVTLQQLSKQHGIKYILLQDSTGILAATESIDTVEAISESAFLKNALGNNFISARVTNHGEIEVYEVVKRFSFNNELVGLFRLGVSLEDIKNVESRMLRRLIIISLILAAISVIVLSIIFTSQNLKAVSNEYEKFKSLTASVLENMSEAVIVFDQDSNISLFNKSAEKLFKAKSVEVIGNKIDDLNNGLLSFLKSQIKILKSSNLNFEKKLQINNEDKVLSFSISPLEDQQLSKLKFTAVIKDLTETKRLEEDAKRNEKLSAMGELASGVAHEIRNPINSIGMIAQRLNKEFTPTTDQTEYYNITSLLRTEVNRINKIITQFLSYAKPIELNFRSVNLKFLFDEVYKLFEDQAKQKGIQFIKLYKDEITAKLDADLIKQALMNLVQNAIDAVKESGQIKLDYARQHSNIIIEISDNGIGITEEQQKKIFDLYFTTKKDGNGLGLSISQKIISQHNGSINVTSQVNKGTTFKIILPMQ
ncbi:MAG: PAS domain S-box protein [Ignavibacteriaceae bacterium]|nr:PAS domain S-box protein [Ignavibacteriaceae bacterium]